MLLCAVAPSLLLSSFLHVINPMHYALLYTDPGTGSLIWQLLIAAVFGGLFYVRRIKEAVAARMNRKRDEHQTADEIESDEA